MRMDEVLGMGVASWKAEELSIPDEIQQLAEARFQARRAKNWAESDRLREELHVRGWNMEDGTDAYTLKKKES